MTPHIEILRGPSKFDLMVSLFEGNPTLRKYVQFNIYEQRGGGIMGHSIPVAIMGIRQEDGSGESWLFEGYCSDSEWRNREQGYVFGYYSSQTRTGFIRSGVDDSYCGMTTRQEAIDFRSKKSRPL
jgi:hypothetical protein